MSEADDSETRENKDVCRSQNRSLALVCSRSFLGIPVGAAGHTTHTQRIWQFGRSPVWQNFGSSIWKLGAFKGSGHVHIDAGNNYRWHSGGDRNECR
jgi:hypothetical protein